MYENIRLQTSRLLLQSVQMIFPLFMLILPMESM